MNSRQLKAIIVMQDVRTGSLLTFAASDPATLDVTSSLMPLSTVKLLVAASWLTHEKSAPPNFSAENALTASIVGGNDNAGRLLATALRRAIGTDGVVKDLEAFGFQRSQPSLSEKDAAFWSEIAPKWRDKLIPDAASHSLGAETTIRDWEETLSIGEARFTITAFHLSRFLQAIGNRGIMLPPKARSIDQNEAGSKIQPRRIVDEETASSLENAMRGTVQRGTAKGIATVLEGTGWSIGGKTGTGPGPSAPGPGSDGCFAGLIFDSHNDARFTVVSFVKHGGLGGGNAAWLSAKLAKFVIGADSKR